MSHLKKHTKRALGVCENLRSPSRALAASRNSRTAEKAQQDRKVKQGGELGKGMGARTRKAQRCWRRVYEDSW
eukprot:2393-Pleurochrysis_carterae.AAC.1